MVGDQFGAAVGGAGDDAGELDVLRRCDERGVEVPATHPVPDQSEPHMSSPVRRRACRSNVDVCQVR